jgi:16S rRNA (guanine527-N7)-methyltransferase
MSVLRIALQARGIVLDPGTMQGFSSYREHLIAWNRRINLISRGDESHIVTRHFLESMGLLFVTHFPEGCRVMDLGTGAGFPGIPMKLVRPDLRLVLVESKRRKARFLREMVQTLGLHGVEVVLGRVECLGTTLGTFDFVVSRAVADMLTLARWSRGFLVSTGGKLISIKGCGVVEELGAVQAEALGLGVRGWRVLSYDPFPEVIRLRESVVAIVEW